MDIPFDLLPVITNTSTQMHANTQINQNSYKKEISTFLLSKKYYLMQKALLW